MLKIYLNCFLSNAVLLEAGTVSFSLLDESGQLLEVVCLNF